MIEVMLPHHQVMNMLFSCSDGWMGLTGFNDESLLKKQVIAPADVTGTELHPKASFSCHSLKWHKEQHLTWHFQNSFKDIDFLMAKVRTKAIT